MKKVFIWIFLVVGLFASHNANANNLSQVDRSFIIRNEGIILKPYNDVANYKTICIGHLVRSNEHIKSSYSIEECLRLFERDLTMEIVMNNECIHRSLNDDQFTSIIDFQFNIGASAACKSTLFNDVEMNKDSKVYDDFLMWRYIRVNGKLIQNNGIMNRRVREGNLYDTPVDKPVDSSK